MNTQYTTKPTPPTIRLADYTAPPYRVISADLSFNLDPERTMVRATLEVARATETESSATLELNGESLDLISIALNGRQLSVSEYVLTGNILKILSPPKSFTLDTEVAIAPEGNEALEGLFRSNDVYCTQCEPEGFRRISFFPDRPDVMTTYRTTIIAPKDGYPVLLSNGNLVDSGEMEGGRHFATWYDPFPKPSYLFALVAGDLAYIEDNFRTVSGRVIQLRIYIEHGKESRSQYAMESLKRAMRWDEQAYSREYDLDVFNIVAVSDFNMGAMENKGLNIFNDRFILADPETATDIDYYLIESIIAHEYFHNWSGNRVTCRDWFQLCLKEGLTVFRDQEFTAEMRNSANKRIDDVSVLRVSQFREDAGPLAHPIRPDNYIEINNFYTSTVYQKGAEVIRMMQTILGKEKFRKGMDLYFSRYDGQAVTCDDFVATMEETSGTDLKQFKLWYSQAGTPHVEVDEFFDPQSGIYKLTLHQNCKPTPGQPIKEPFHIPLAIGLIDELGTEIPLQTEGDDQAHSTGTVILELKEPTGVFIFENVNSSNPRLSINRSFSAPITMARKQASSDQAFMVAHDSDPFNRWAVGQEYSTSVILDILDHLVKGHTPSLDPAFLDAMGKVAVDTSLDDAFRASLLELPTEDYISTCMAVEDPINLHKARKVARRQIAAHHRKIFDELYNGLRTDIPYAPDAAGMGRRMLKRVNLGYIAALESPETAGYVKDLFDNADNMTERMDTLDILNATDTPQRSQALQGLYDRFENDHLVVNKWFSLHASSPLPGTLSVVKKLLGHPAFDLKNPNKIRALVGTFTNLNPVNFHAIDGSGYKFLADRILEIDKFNPLMAARLVLPLGRWKRFAPTRQLQIKTQLERIITAQTPSRDVYEMVGKSLGR
jgi:aminopeptidase N